MNYYKTLSGMLMIALMIMTAVAYREGQTINSLNADVVAYRGAINQLAIPVPPQGQLK